MPLHTAIHVNLPVNALQRSQPFLAVVRLEDPDGHVRELSVMPGVPGP